MILIIQLDKNYKINKIKKVVIRKDQLVVILKVVLEKIHKDRNVKILKQKKVWWHIKKK